MKFEVEIENDDILRIFRRISGEGIHALRQFCERYGEEEDEVRRYEVYEILTASGEKILKKTHRAEASNYEKYLANRDFPVPKFYGKWEDDTGCWILLEKIPGNDLRGMTDQLALSAAASLTEIQNAYWMTEEAGARFEAYWKRINDRFEYIKKEPAIAESYSLFLKRQLTCPRTLSNGDFLQFNGINHNGRVFIIDWGFGGILPYSLDIARFLAHGTPDRATFPFYMNEGQKKLFVERVYQNLNRKPEYPQYILDVKLAVLNEYVEFMEAGEDENGWYRRHALRLAEEIIRS